MVLAVSGPCSKIKAKQTWTKPPVPTFQVLALSEPPKGCLQSEWSWRHRRLGLCCPRSSFVWTCERLRADASAMQSPSTHHVCSMHGGTFHLVAAAGKRMLVPKGDREEEEGGGDRQQVTQSEPERETGGNRMTSGGKDGARDRLGKTGEKETQQRPGSEGAG